MATTVKTRGRPSEYTTERADEILQRLATGEPLRSICRDEHLPSEAAVRLWVIDDREGFAARYARARDLQLESWADESVEIADDGTNDWIERETKRGTVIRTFDNEHAIRSRLRVDTRKWLLAKLKPEKYGDQLPKKQSAQRAGVKRTSAETETLRAKAKSEWPHKPHLNGKTPPTMQ